MEVPRGFTDEQRRCEIEQVWWCEQAGIGVREGMQATEGCKPWWASSDATSYQRKHVEDFGCGLAFVHRHRRDSELGEER